MVQRGPPIYFDVIDCTKPFILYKFLRIVVIDDLINFNSMEWIERSRILTCAPFTITISFFIYSRFYNYKFVLKELVTLRKTRSDKHIASKLLYL